MKTGKADRVFLWIVVILVTLGLFIFISASLGIHVQEEVRFSRVVFNQLLFGIIMGGGAFLICARIPLTFWQKYSFWIFLFSFLLTLTVFIPELGFEHGGAKRWISIGPLTLQPAETLKIGASVYFGTLLVALGKKVSDIKAGFGTLIAIIFIIGIPLLIQPDTDTFIVIVAGLCAMFLVAGGRFVHIGALIITGAVCLAGLIFMRPYLLERITVFINPASDPQGAGYQVQQSLIAIGSGGIFGRGMGQSIQKFNYLPEPIGDSIFAVFAEEWGFVGTIVLISLFYAFVIRGFTIAKQSRSSYGTYIAVGIITMITLQSLINISSMLSLFPLSGIPLTFVSKGGTSLLIALAAVGIVLAVSKQKKSRAIL